MKKLPMVVAAIFFGVIWLFYAVGYGVYGLLGFYVDASKRGVRTTICGTSGCSNLEFFLLVAWQIGVIILIYILPIVIIMYLVRSSRKKKKVK